VAVKKTAKKSAAKKTVAKKKVAKKSVAKKTTAKKAVAKKPAAKKVAAKKAVAKKSAAKKPAAKKVAKKAPAKKATTTRAAAKKAASKKVGKKVLASAPVAERIIIPAVPSKGSAPVTKSISTTPPPVAPVASAAQTSTAKPAQPKSSNRVVLAVFVGIVLLAVAVVSRNHTSTSSTNTAAPTQSAAPTESAVASAAPTESAATDMATPATTTAAAATAEKPAPVGIVAHYTKSGATIFWKAADGATGIANYNVEIRSNGGDWKLISTVPASQLSLDITKGDTSGWSSFRVSAVYADGTAVAGLVFGLPGQYS
jgi:hypothetical protein